jgi:predicted dehydrogenase
MFARPLVQDFPETAELVALCDPNPKRMAAITAELGDAEPVHHTDFGEMLRQADPDAIVVTTRDCHHAEYVIAALRAGKWVFSEKPLCTTARQCRDILAAAAESDGLCLVTHNARYSAAVARARELIGGGRLGHVTNMQYHETLDRCHGADYFRRWHRVKANSGGLLVHKASHHFDVLNFFAGANPAVRAAPAGSAVERPEWVNATGSLRFYGANGPFRGPRCSRCEHADRCDFHVDLTRRDTYRKLYFEAEGEDDYFRDGCVFDESIDIEDQMYVLLRYGSGLEVSYTLTAYCPYESERIVVEGTEGRLEYVQTKSTGWAMGSQHLPGIETIASESLKLYRPDEGIEEISLERGEGGHGGADPQLRRDFFGRDWCETPNEQMASVEEAAQAVLVGAAANESIATGRPVAVQELLKPEGAA